MTLTTDQVQIIRSTIPVLQTHGNEITTVFYRNLLREVPKLNNVFNQTNQATNQQAAVLAGALYAYASNIDNLGALSPAVEKICQKHASLYIRADQYEVVGTYLLNAMGDVLGDAMTQDILGAWTAAYWQLAQLMINREDELAGQANGWTDWRDFKIADKVKESEEITSFYLKPLDSKSLPPFLPGQYISVMMDSPSLEYKQSRQYSLSDAPGNDYYRISVKKEDGIDQKQQEAVPHPGVISNILHGEKNIGDVIKVSHPAGEFFLDLEKDAGKPLVLIAAGVGLTPMLSILNTSIKEDSQRRISFIHASRSEKVRAFGSHIRKVTAEHPNVISSIFVKSCSTSNSANGSNNGSNYHDGRLRLEVLDRDRDLGLDDAESLYFVCGPDGFMADVHKGLRAMGVDEGRIRMEVFGVGTVPE